MAEKSKPTPKKDKDQAARFIETARLLEADETGEAFERAVKVVLPEKTQG
ncbi:hypothetical protein [Devosia sp.]